jgi:hypothetical protein
LIRLGRRRDHQSALRVTTDKTQIKFYARREDLREALKRAAENDMRSVSVLIELILIDWLEARGYLLKLSGERGEV